MCAAQVGDRIKDLVQDFRNVSGQGSWNVEFQAYCVETDLTMLKTTLFSPHACLHTLVKIPGTIDGLGVCCFFRHGSATSAIYLSIYIYISIRTIYE